jgi:hypothetical protein
VQFPLLDQVELILADLLRAELLRRSVKVLGETPDSADVGKYGSLRVITALEFIEQSLT